MTRILFAGALLLAFNRNAPLIKARGKDQIDGFQWRAPTSTETFPK